MLFIKGYEVSSANPNTLTQLISCTGPRKARLNQSKPNGIVLLCIFFFYFRFFLSLKKSWSFDCPIKENMGTVIVLSTVVASLSVLYQSCAIRKGQRWNIYTFTRAQGMRVNDKKGNQIDKKVDCKIEWKLIQRSSRFYYSLPPTDSPTVSVSKFISSDSSMLEF